MADLYGTKRVLTILYRRGISGERLERWERAYRFYGCDAELLKAKVLADKATEPRTGARYKWLEASRLPALQTTELRQISQRSPAGTVTVHSMPLHLPGDQDVDPVFDPQEPYPDGWPDHVEYLPAHLTSR